MHSKTGLTQLVGERRRTDIDDDDEEDQKRDDRMT